MAEQTKLPKSTHEQLSHLTKEELITHVLSVLPSYVTSLPSMTPPGSVRAGAKPRRHTVTIPVPTPPSIPASNRRSLRPNLLPQVLRASASTADPPTLEGQPTSDHSVSIPSNHTVTSCATSATFACSATTLEETEETSVNHYSFLKELGRGSCGKVMLAYDSAEDRLVAIERVARTSERIDGTLREPQGYQTFLRAVDRTKKLRHKNIVSVYEVIDDPEADSLYLVMQYIDKGVIAPIEVRTGTTKVCEPIHPRQLASSARQMLAGLDYLHRHNVVHRDIKPDNILVSKNGRVVLADFGVAELLSRSMRERKTSQLKAKGSIGHSGAMIFIAPELWEGTKSYGKPVDMWAVGVTLFTLLTGTLPFRNLDEISDVNLPVMPANHGSEWVQLLQGLLHRDPSQRLTASEARGVVAVVEAIEISRAAAAPKSENVTSRGAISSGEESSSAGSKTVSSFSEANTVGTSLLVESQPELSPSLIIVRRQSLTGGRGNSFSNGGNLTSTCDSSSGGENTGHCNSATSDSTSDMSTVSSTSLNVVEFDLGGLVAASEEVSCSFPLAVVVPVATLSSNSESSFTVPHALQCRRASSRTGLPPLSGRPSISALPSSTNPRLSEAGLLWVGAASRPPLGKVGAAGPAGAGDSVQGSDCATSRRNDGPFVVNVVKILQESSVSEGNGISSFSVNSGAVSDPTLSIRENQSTPLVCDLKGEDIVVFGVGVSRQAAPALCTLTPGYGADIIDK